MNNRLLGVSGEATAVMYLKKKHYKIIETNYSCRAGEIDIIAKKDDILVFVEVKTRSSNAFGTPAEAITLKKQQHIIRSAQFFMLEHAVVNTQVRFDAIEVIDKRVNHIVDAFRIN